jgi:hypothetical protein
MLTGPWKAVALPLVNATLLLRPLIAVRYHGAARYREPRCRGSRNTLWVRPLSIYTLSTPPT